MNDTQLEQKCIKLEEMFLFIESKFNNLDLKIVQKRELVNQIYIQDVEKVENTKSIHEECLNEHRGCLLIKLNKKHAYHIYHIYKGYSDPAVGTYSCTCQAGYNGINCQNSLCILSCLNGLFKYFNIYFRIKKSSPIKNRWILSICEWSTAMHLS